MPLSNNKTGAALQVYRYQKRQMVSQHWLKPLAVLPKYSFYLKPAAAKADYKTLTL
jgi:hypothetical protein